MRKDFIKRIFSAAAAIITISAARHVSAEESNYASVLIEAGGGVVISGQNEETRIPVGTAAKLMTVLLTAEQIESGKLSLDTKLKTSSYANSMQGAQIWLMPNEEITVDELLKAVIIGNANDASAVLAEAVSGSEEKFTELMNKRAKELGMENTVFTNCNGHYDSEKQLSSAHDIVRLCAEFSKHDFLRGYFTCWRDFVRGGQTELVNPNEAVKSFKGIIGFKAGYCEASGHYAVLGAERDGVTYISAVFGCEDKDRALAEAKKLVSSAFSQYTVFTPERPDDIPAEISVKGGMTRTVPIECGKIRRVVLPNGSAGSVKARTVLPDYIYAPVEEGQVVGEVQFIRKGKMLFRTDIYATGRAEKMTVFKALCIIFKKMFSF